MLDRQREKGEGGMKKIVHKKERRAVCVACIKYSLSSSHTQRHNSNTTPIDACTYSQLNQKQRIYKGGKKVMSLKYMLS